MEAETLDFIKKKEHAIKLKNINARLKALKIYNYAKEFSDIDTDLLYKVKNSRAYSFEVLDAMDKRLTIIENFVAESKVVKK